MPRSAVAMPTLADEVPNTFVAAPVLSQNPFCVVALRLLAHLQLAVRNSALMLHGTGDYVLQGQVSETVAPQLRAVVDSLQRENHAASLTMWNGADSQSNKRTFLLEGRIPARGIGELTDLRMLEAAQLLTELSVQVRRSGLQSVVDRSAGSVVLGNGRVQQSHELWASGSVADVHRLVGSLDSMRQRARVSKLVLKPDPGNGAGSQLYVAVDLLVVQKPGEVQ
ncbi:MAG: hypothetical protein VX733_04435 [Candidatus Latescibacterota bacterium]|nr:hypothetical protein [Candidatus Latescibacterota bacterium]